MRYKKGPVTGIKHEHKGIVICEKPRVVRCTDWPNCQEMWISGPGYYAFNPPLRVR